MEQAVLVGLKGNDRLVEELKTLCYSVGIKTVKIFIVPLAKPSAPWLLGKGKTEEIIEWAVDNEADMIIFNPPLSPSQQRNWEKASGLCVIDRQEIILEIFSSFIKPGAREVTIAVNTRIKIISVASRF